MPCASSGEGSYHRAWAPSEYSRLLETSHGTTDLDGNLKSHLIDPEYLWADDFEGYLRQRARALLQKIGEVMGKDLHSDMTDEVDMPIDYDETELDFDIVETIPAESVGEDRNR